MRIALRLLLSILCIAPLLLISGCGSSSKDDNDFIPPYIDPNGGPVLTIDVGADDGSDSTKKVKINTYQKTHTEYVKLYKLDGTLIGAATKIQNSNWQIQVADNSPILIRAKLKNHQGGNVHLETLVASPATGTIPINTKSTAMVYICLVNAYLQSLGPSQISNLTNALTTAENDYSDLVNDIYLKNQLSKISNTSTDAELVDDAEIYVKRFLAVYSIYFKITSSIAQLESGALETTINPTAANMYATGGDWDIKVLTTGLNTTILKKYIEAATHSRLKISISGGSIKIDTIPTSSNSKTVSLGLNANDIIALQNYFSTPNNPPVFTSTAPSTAIVGTPYSYILTATDADSDTLKFTGTTIPNWLTLSGSTLSGTPQLTDIGETTVIISVTDNRVTTAITQSYTLTVLATAVANAAPVITSLPVTTATEKIFYQYKITATDSDNDKLTFSAITKPTWLKFNVVTGLLSGTPTAADVGDHSVSLQVSDGKQNVLQSFTLTVELEPTNNPPVFTNPGTLNATEGVTFTKTIQATDADNDPLTFAVTKIPGWLTFNATSGVLTGKPSNSDFNNGKVTITVTDGKVDTPVELKLDIKINTIPNISSNPVTSVVAGTIYQYKIVASDKDGDKVTVTVPTLPAWMTYTATGTILNGSPTSTEIGVYDVSIIASDNKAVTSGKQNFTVQVLNSALIAKVNGTEVTNNENFKFQNSSVSLSIAERTSNSGFTFSIKLDGTALVLTNNATSVTLTEATHTVEFIATDSSQVQNTVTVNLIEDTDRKVDITLDGGLTNTSGEYRKVPGTITVSADFHGVVTDPIIEKSILLDGVPQSLDSNKSFLMDPTTIAAGSHTITGNISFTNSKNETQTSSTTITFILIENNKATQVVKIDSLVVSSDISFGIHAGNSVVVTTSSHSDADDDTITKGLYINGVLNADLTTYTVNLNSNETKVIKTYLKDPYEESESYTITLSASTTNGGIPVTLSATGTKLTNSTTTYRDKVNGVANTATIKATLGVDSENDGVKLIEWLVNNVVKTGQNDPSLVLDLSTFGGTTVAVTCRVTDNYTSSPAITTATINIVVDLDQSPVFSSATVDSVAIALGAAISVDHSLSTSKTFIPLAADPEGDSFTYQYKLNSSTSSGSQFSIPNSTLSGSTLTVNTIQFNTVAGTDTHNITANNVVPTPIFVGNLSHVDLNGNYSLIVRPGIDLEGDKLVTTVTLNGTPISGVVIGNEIHYSVNMTALGNTTANFVATNNDSVATPVSASFNVPVTLSLPPTSLTATRGAGSITLSWNSVNTALSYNLYYGTAINITTGSTKISSITSPYTLSGLTNGTTYYFRVSANHVSGEGTLSGTDIPMTPHAAGDSLTVTVNAQPFIFKYIPAGSFTMGAPSTETGFENGESPQHVVTISKGFWMLQTEITQDQYFAISATNSSYNVGGTLPVENVNWEEIEGTNGFISKLHLADVNTTLTSGLYMLPTEAQWEYACRAGTTTRFFWGSDDSLSLISTYAWYSANTTTTKTVGGKTANSWGLYDMSGNVSEWCRDKTPSAYTSADVTDPTGGSSGNERVYRGGSWYDSGNNCRSAKRYSASKDIKGTNLGFRIIRIPLDTE